ncbi:MAG: PocR ligand-binding domain-containing protein, partial [Phycisphaerae bacterium]|nr:PocR ligand-binding domain-containing protein [Phycisphaerae bacterium]
MKITLRVRVFALVSVLVVSSTLALSGFLLHDFRCRLQADFQARGSVIVRYFAMDSVEGIIIENDRSLARTINRLFEIEDVAYAAIYDDEATRIAGRAAPSLGAVPDGAPAQNTRTTEVRRRMVGNAHGTPVLDFLSPVIDSYGEHVGWVQMGLSLERIGIETQEMAAHAFLLLVIFVGVGSVASFLVANSIANPIKALARVFTVIAAGDLDHPIDTSRTDELGSLSANFAAMRDSIRQKLKLLEAESLVRARAEQELQRHRDNLEELVRERTAELASANAELKNEIAERMQIQEQLKQSLDELARHNNAMSGREKRIVELKAQVNSLLDELGRERAFTEADTTPEPCGGLMQPVETDRVETATVALRSFKGKKELQTLLESFCESVGIAAAIIDLEGEVLVGARWQTICTDFHRKNPEACRKCVESDTLIANQLREGERFSVYTCRNGLTDAASPIIVNGQHIANFFVGQFLLDPPDEAFFRKQAALYGFPETEY